MISTAVRVGIDVGGTHTKAVAIDNVTHEIIGKASVSTTHHAKEGVALGVVQAFTKCLEEHGIKPDDVVFIAHSTTQATNALLEGDVAHVGVLGILRGGIEDLFSKKQMKCGDIELGSNKKIPVTYATIKRKDLSPEAIVEKMNWFKEQGVTTLVTSVPFGVDHPEDEEMVAKIAAKLSMPVTMASKITKLYGLSRRTKTAAINASILPKMFQTATSTEDSVKSTGVKSPLMIVRGDGGVMDLNEMKKTPILTMLSGPAASVMGALMYLRVSNGIYFEVGGTSTNIGVIKNGRPTIDYSTVGGHKTYVTSLDITVLGVAGGSMVRAGAEGIIDVGPRSAHIAGMDYSAFTEKDIKEPRLELFSPTEGDPADYVAIRLQDGNLITITTTCAANALGLLTPEEYSYGNVEQASKAMKPLADYLKLSVEETARQILDKAFEKIQPVILELGEKYKLDKSQMTLIGVGGGAASLLKYSAEKMNMKYSIPKHAEVISSIGVALAMVRNVVERMIPNPSLADIRQIKMEALDGAIASGASPESVEVHLEIDSTTSKVTAIATGSTEVKTTDLLKACTMEEAKGMASEDMGLSRGDVELVESNEYFFVFQSKKEREPAIRILDSKGFIKVQRANGDVRKVLAKDYETILKKMWNDLAVYKSDSVLRPDFYLLAGTRLMDFSLGSDLEQLKLLISESMDDVPEDETIIVIGVRNEL